MRAECRNESSTAKFRRCAPSWRNRNLKILTRRLIPLNSTVEGNFNLGGFISSITKPRASSRASSHSRRPRVDVVPGKILGPLAGYRREDHEGIHVGSRVLRAEFVPGILISAIIRRRRRIRDYPPDKNAFGKTLGTDRQG